ncbi:DUF4199 domain-containing protein [Parasphingopyxis marina]|uniref:DUF4199 domain-containing protein n=1 Tax=Parasphingopyxis marina TaxID=2761622 RepID=A0A842HRT1_9SPHN|nr:DUF4199 domain-containing protein [Parasphingopyxis marina]MBC2776528.1 DUF4199 domain-containing protein [Parasphingopyxis marina]
MGRYAFLYGGLSGLVVIAAMLLGIVASDSQGFFASEWFGYLIMLIALSLIFIGIKRYRDIERGGVIRFGRAFGLGLGIAAIAALVYVLVWESYLYTTDYAFIDRYIAAIVESARAEGLTGAALAAKLAEMDALRENYGNPLFRLPMTFLEIFPIGLIVALISAAILRKPEILSARAVSGQAQTVSDPESAASTQQQG